jgi:DinB superfamily
MELERCEGCGFVWDLVPPAEVVFRIDETANRYRRLLLPPDRPAGWAERVGTRPAEGVWSPLEYACHVRDVLFVQRDRVFVILVEDEPTFGPMHREERVTLGAYGQEELADVVAQIETAARMLARTLGLLSAAQFERRGIYGYPAPASRSLGWVGAQSLHEMLHHLDDITAALAPQRLGLAAVAASPADRGLLELIVARPAVGERLVLDQATLVEAAGLSGDNWATRGSRRTADGSAHPDMQLNLMNSRAAALLCGDRDRWPLAGDQLYVDFDLSVANVPPGTRLAIGDTVVEITAIPHRGCAKFSSRFGRDALRLVNSEDGRALNLRGVNAKVVTAGSIRQGDAVIKVDRA